MYNIKITHLIRLYVKRNNTFLFALYELISWSIWIF